MNIIELQAIIERVAEKHGGNVEVHRFEDGQWCVCWEEWHDERITLRDAGYQDSLEEVAQALLEEAQQAEADGTLRR